MKCPYCGSVKQKVVDKRESPDLSSTRRRRECLDCTKRFTTYERIEEVEIIVIKKDGSRLAFDRNKVLRGITRSCQKRPVTYEDIQKMVDRIEISVRKRDSVEIKSSQIGTLVMRELKKADKVSYIRFASVYKDFADLEEFEEEVTKLIRRKPTVSKDSETK